MHGWLPGRGRPGRKKGMFRRFSPLARQVIIDAQREARDLRHGYIGTEHLLLRNGIEAAQPAQQSA